MVYADDDGNDGDSDCDGNDAAAAADGNDVDDDNGSDSTTRKFDDNSGTMRMYLDDDGNEDDGRDSNGNGDGDGNSNDDATANGANVNEDDSSNLRTTIGRRQLDNNNGTTMMRW
jgi:hypothetical protein